MTVQAGGKTRRAKAKPIVADPPITVQGYQKHTIKFTVMGYTFKTGDKFRFSGTGITVDQSSFTIAGNAISGKISAAKTATIGSRKVIFSINGGKRDVTVKDLFTVYRGVKQSLIDVLDRPAPGAKQAFPGKRNGNPRTADQQSRITSVVNATTRAQITSAWNSWANADGSLTIPPSPIDQKQIDVLIDAAVQIEGNTNKPTLGMPDVPLTMWKAFLTHLADVESADKVLAMAGVASENSYGILQFNDGRASGTKFTGEPMHSVPIYKPGIKTDWKAYFIAATSIADLKTRMGALADWRADPYASLVNGIRSTQAQYGRIDTGAGGYQAGDDYRVDLVPPARANGKGNQRDVFECFGVVHRLPSDVFGGTFGGVSYYGGRVQTTTPNEWHTSGTEPTTGKKYMTADGTTRAESFRTYYNSNAPSGGYK